MAFKKKKNDFENKIIKSEIHGSYMAVLLTRKKNIKTKQQTNDDKAVIVFSGVDIDFNPLKYQRKTMIDEGPRSIARFVPDDIGWTSAVNCIKLLANEERLNK